MIPWSTFQTPQDAYEWAKKNAGQLEVRCVTLLGCRTFLVGRGNAAWLIMGKRAVRR